MKMRFRVHELKVFPASTTVIMYPVGCFEGVYTTEVTKKLVDMKEIETVEGEDTIVTRQHEVDEVKLIRNDESNTDWCAEAPSGCINLSVDINREFFVAGQMYDFEVSLVKV